MTDGMEQIADTSMYVAYDDDTDTWSVYERMGRKMEPRGVVYEELYDEDGKRYAPPRSWSSARHTFTGTPAEHGEGFTTKEGAALSLQGAKPFRDVRYNHPSLEYDQETGGRVTPSGTVDGV